MASNNLLDRLVSFEPTPFPVISVYLNTQPDQHGRDNFDAFVRRELKARAKKWTMRTPERESFDRDADRINEYLRDELRPSSNGVAIFACSAERDFFEAAQFDAPIEENHLYTSYQPSVYSLARFIDHYPPYVALLADTNVAHLYVFGAGEEIEQRDVVSPNVHRTMIGGWSQARFQRHIDNIRAHHAKEVVEELDRLTREENIDRIVLAGDEVIIPMLREQLPQRLGQMVIDTLRLDVATPEHEVMKASFEAVRAHDERKDAEKIEKLLDKYLGSGYAVTGARDTLIALTLGQVDEIFLSASEQDVRDDLKGKAAELIPGLPEDVEGNGGARNAAIADELVARARQTHADVTFIEDATKLAACGGVGAKLRFRL
ncbi:MAG TPA: Vms1/Ankzf1 family peptidyl-tRNA hydrolase [Blastocatellia bacterium]|jgi:peptide chain release factor subunit 1|nr:Vms1/Ankzf1 family peptidyl-tRNA hydrolase [Blastocatellia bacterium]